MMWTNWIIVAAPDDVVVVVLAKKSALIRQTTTKSASYRLRHSEMMTTLFRMLKSFR